jgi:hypothetical protein
MPSVTFGNSALPTSPQPTVEAACPYLDSQFVAQTNGEHVSKVRVSADKPYPACFFYRANEDVQLTARILVTDSTAAKALVDMTAPIATSDRAELPGGWSGGTEVTATGSTYAVAKTGTALVVTSNQKQTIKAKQVAIRVLSELGL